METAFFVGVWTCIVNIKQTVINKADRESSPNAGNTQPVSARAKILGKIEDLNFNRRKKR